MRAFRSVGGTPYFVARAEGAYVWDVEGRRYIDYVQSYGASILGHAHPAVIEAITRRGRDGTTYGAPDARRGAAGRGARRAGSPAVEQVRLVSSGHRGHDVGACASPGASPAGDTIVKFAGCYHGHSDALLAAGGSGVANQGLSGSAGVTAGAVADTVVAPYNVVPELDERRGGGDRRAGRRQHGPRRRRRPGSSRGCGTRATAVGALLIFDEVITGFRLAVGGASELLRRAARPVVLRQGHRRRPAGRRVRRSAAR